MPQVPFSPLQTVAPSTPMEPQNVPAATPAAFGAELGQAEQQAGQMLANVGQELWASQQRVTNREDAIERVRDYGAFQSKAQQKLISLQTEGDLSRQDTVNGYREFVDKTRDEIVMQHRGSPESRMQLMAKLEEDRIGLIGNAAALSVKAQQDMMERAVGAGMNVLSGRAFESPASVPQLFEQMDRQLADIAPGLTPEQEAQFKMAGRAKIAGSAVESLVTRGAFDDAERILSMPGVAETIGTEAQNKMRGVILQSRLKLRDAGMTGIAEGTKERSKLRTLLGREPTDSEVAIAAGIAPKDGAGGGMFGSGLTGRSLSIITDGASLYAQGMLNPQQEQVFESALTQYRQPTWSPNPDTGVMELRRPELPPFVAEALRRRGVPVPQSAPAPGGPQEPSILGNPVGQTDRGEPIYEAPNDATALRMMNEVNRSGQRAVVRVGGADGAPREQKIWDMAGKVAGPIAAGANLLGRTPIIGDMVQFPSFTQAKNYIPILVNDLVKVLQNSPQYAQGERKQIQSEIELEPKAFDTPAAFRNRLIGVDKALAVREKNAYETARNPQVSQTERRHAMDVFNGIIKFRDSLGIPPTYTPQEYTKLKASGVLQPGDKFLDKEGVERTVQ